MKITRSLHPSKRKKAGIVVSFCTGKPNAEQGHGGIGTRRLFAAVLICVIIAAAFGAYVVLSPPPPPVSPNLQIGIDLYVWYGARPSLDWKSSSFIDFPTLELGNYSSQNRTVIRKQLVLIEDLGVDFVVISWWGFDDDYEKFIDNATKIVFETAQSINSTLKFTVMVEPTHNRPDSGKFGQRYEYDEIYNHVYETFVEPYSDLYFNYGGKPLICFFNDETLTPEGVFPQDNRFTIISVGTEPYVQWIYTYLTGQIQNPTTTQTSVTPRFDDSRVPGRNYSQTVDANLTEGTYDEQWQNAIRLLKEGKIDIITITSWNEYPERTAIEPHYDGTATNPDPYFLYTKTKQHIRQLHTYELNLQIHSEDYNPLAPSHLLDLGATWVRMDYEINKTEPIMTALHNKGYKILAIIDSRTREFTTLEDWNNTLLSIVSNPVSQLIDAWEIWNEPNAVMGAYIAPSDYREMLRCAYAILKNSTKGLIISGGLAPHDNFATYLNQTFADSDINAYYDFFGLHLYNETLPVNSAYIEEAKTVTNRDPWITEMGRPSKTGNYSEEDQASYLANNIGEISPKVEKIFVYELYDHAGPSEDKECYFGLLTTGYAKKPAYFKLKEPN